MVRLMQAVRNACIAHPDILLAQERIGGTSPKKGAKKTADGRPAAANDGEPTVKVGPLAKEIAQRASQEDQPAGNSQGSNASNRRVGATRAMVQAPIMCRLGLRSLSAMLSTLCQIMNQIKMRALMVAVPIWSSAWQRIRPKLFIYVLCVIITKRAMHHSCVCAVTCKNVLQTRARSHQFSVQRCPVRACLSATSATAGCVIWVSTGRNVRRITLLHHLHSLINVTRICVLRSGCNGW